MFDFRSNPHRLSPLHDLLSGISERARWYSFQGMPTPLDFGDPAAEAVQARTLALSDVSCRPMIVVKGRGAEAFLTALKIAIPAEILGISTHKSFVCRTGGSEFFLESSPKLIDALKSAGPGVYAQVRQDVAIVLVGERASEVLREVCAYDFEGNAASDRLVMTRMAGVSCWVWPHAIRGIPAWQLWTDGTFGPYLWETLREIVGELGGTPVGLAAIEPELCELAGNVRGTPA